MKIPKRLILWIGIIALVPIAVIMTLATGAFGTIAGGYGLPLPWKFWAGPCGPNTLCQLILYQPNQNLGWNYNWVLFAVDVAFYTAIGYGLVLLIPRFAWKNRRPNET